MISTTLSLRSLHHLAFLFGPKVGHETQCVMLGEGPWEHVGQRNVVWRHIFSARRRISLYYWNMKCDDFAEWGLNQDGLEEVLILDMDKCDVR